MVLADSLTNLHCPYIVAHSASVSQSCRYDRSLVLLREIINFLYIDLTSKRVPIWVTVEPLFHCFNELKLGLSWKRQFLLDRTQETEASQRVRQHLQCPVQRARPPMSKCNIIYFLTPHPQRVECARAWACTPHNRTDAQTDAHTYRHTYIQTNRQTARQTESVTSLINAINTNVWLHEQLVQWAASGIWVD